jgi:hypothetical protein
MYNKNKKIMKKEFISYEQALALKEIGFDEPCILLYRGLDTQPVCQMDYEFKTDKKSDYNDETDYWLTVPTYSQAFRWFREKYNLNCYIDRGGAKGVYHAFVGGSEHGFLYGNNGNNLSEFTYEEAELECLKKLIEIVKNK